MKNNILTFDLENDKAFLLKVDDKTNDDFNPVKLDSDIISKISNLCIKAKDFKIWAYDGEIKLFYNKKLHNYDNTYKDCLSKQKFENYYNYFNTNISDKERIDFSLSDIDSSIFDIYKLNNNGTYQFYLAHSKSNKNQQVAIRVKLQE